jgi:hypothetical protein
VGRRRLVDNGLEYESTRRDRFTITEGQPLSARVDCERSAGFRRGAWQVRIETNSSLTADATTFHMTNVLEAYEGQARVFAKTWHCRVARDLV